MKSRMFIITYFTFVLAVVGALIGYPIAWGKAGAPVIESKWADDVRVTGFQAKTISGNTYVGGPAMVQIKPLNLAVNSTVYLSGNSLLGTYITGATLPARAPTAGVSIVFLSPTGGESAVVYNDADTTSGNTLYVMFTAGDTVKSNIACTAGTSKYIVGGTALAKKLVIWSTGISTWVVDAIGTPTVEAD